MKKKLQVFVSSTYEDLKLDRQAAVSAILKAGHIPAGMELFTAGDKSQMETIRRWIDESDVYMLILGGRYGSIEQTSGISYTELEYDYALEQGKPLFSVVINESSLEERARASGTHLIEKENPKQLKMFREKVLSNISSFFSDDKDIRLCIYESLSDFSTSRELKGWVSSSEVANSQSLLDEISRLSKENDELKQRLETAEKKIRIAQNNKIATEDLCELTEILEATEIKVPAELSHEKQEFTTDLLNVFLSQKESFITGVTNKAGVNKLDSFLYFNIAPKLQIHELVTNEKVTGVMWRRFSVTQKGIALLAYLEKQRIKSTADA